MMYNRIPNRMINPMLRPGTDYRYGRYFYPRKHENPWLRSLALVGGAALFGGMFIRLKSLAPLRRFLVKKISGSAYRADQPLTYSLSRAFRRKVIRPTVRAVKKVFGAGKFSEAAARAPRAGARFYEWNAFTGPEL